LGFTSAVLAFAIYFVDKNDINYVDDTPIIAVSVTFCVSLLLLIYGVVAALWGKKPMTCVLGFIFFVYFGGLIALGVLDLAYVGKAFKTLEDPFKSRHGNDNHNKTAVAIEKFLNCRTWNDADAKPTNCSSALERYYAKYKIWIAVVYFVLALASIFDSFVAFRSICSSDDQEETEIQSTSAKAMRESLNSNW
jgi:hypothetical protein